MQFNAWITMESMVLMDQKRRSREREEGKYGNATMHDNNGTFAIVGFFLRKLRK